MYGKIVSMGCYNGDDKCACLPTFFLSQVGAGVVVVVVV